MCHILFVLPFIGLLLFWLLPFPQALALYLAVLIVCAFLYRLMWRDRWRPVTTGVEGMIGEKGEVIESSNGTLKVSFRGEIWNVISPKDLSVGQRVEITGVERMRVVVRPMSLN
jgi:membrane protein implicated in regulation of membrane protease activity